MIDCQMTIDRAEILSITSTRSNRITLPYANTGNVVYLANTMIADHVGAIGSYSNATEGDQRLSEDVSALLDHSTIKG